MQTNQTGIAKIKPDDIISYKDEAVVTTRMMADFYSTDRKKILGRVDELVNMKYD